jgi:hypothetical protein
MACQIFAGVEMSNLKKGSRVTPSVDLNEKAQYQLDSSKRTGIFSEIYSPLGYIIYQT